MISNGFLFRSVLLLLVVSLAGCRDKGERARAESPVLKPAQVKPNAPVAAAEPARARATPPASAAVSATAAASVPPPVVEPPSATRGSLDLTGLYDLDKSHGEPDPVAGKSYGELSLFQTGTKIVGCISAGFCDADFRIEKGQALEGRPLRFLEHNLGHYPFPQVSLFASAGRYFVEVSAPTCDGLGGGRFRLGKKLDNPKTCVVTAKEADLVFERTADQVAIGMDGDAPPKKLRLSAGTRLDTLPCIQGELGVKKTTFARLHDQPDKVGSIVNTAIQCDAP